MADSSIPGYTTSLDDKKNLKNKNSHQKYIKFTCWKVVESHLTHNNKL